MIDEIKREKKKQDKQKTRNRMHVKIDPDNYEYYEADKETDYYDNDVNQRVGIYVRVSTDDVKQTTSFELQKKYYEDFVEKHPNWTLVKIYADEGKSGTNTRHRPSFNQMISDAKEGKLDMIITKSVSRFARNVIDCIGIVRELAEQKHPVGVFFESECIFSLKEESQMGLSFLATMAEEESHTRSRSMETSLRMRLDNGIPLTPKLLGYTQDEEGNLIINHKEAPTVKLCFFMYLYGYSTKQIASALNALGRRSYLGNINWSAGGIVQILRNERHCGDVLTRKTYTPSYRDHKSKINKGKRPQSLYKNHHEAIVSRDDFIAVQRMLDNAKYGNKSFLPELKVIDSGVLKGFVTINPKWAGFKSEDYIKAASSIYNSTVIEQAEPVDDNIQIEVSAGDFDFRDFEVVRSELFDTSNQPSITFTNKKIKLSANIVSKLKERNTVELLVNPITKQFAIRPTLKTNRQNVICSKLNEKRYCPREISAGAFYDTLLNIFEWKSDYKYRIVGSIFEKDGEIVYIFDTGNSEAFLNSYLLSIQNTNTTNNVQPLYTSGNRIKAIPEKWTATFGEDFYIHENSLSYLENQNEEDWKLRIDGQLFDSGNHINVTDFNILKDYIKTELNSVILEE